MASEFVITLRKLCWLTGSNVVSFHSVKTLDMSDKDIKSIRGLESLTNLEEISLANNMIDESSILAVIQSLSDSVQKLDLSNNPICKMHNYRRYTIANTTAVNLRVLDGKLITPLERRYSIQLYPTSHLARTSPDQQVATENASAAPLSDIFGSFSIDVAPGDRDDAENSLAVAEVDQLTPEERIQTAADAVFSSEPAVPTLEAALSRRNGDKDVQTIHSSEVDYMISSWGTGDAALFNDVVGSGGLHSFLDTTTSSNVSPSARPSPKPQRLLQAESAADTPPKQCSQETVEAETSKHVEPVAQIPSASSDQIDDSEQPNPSVADAPAAVDVSVRSQIPSSAPISMASPSRSTSDWASGGSGLFDNSDDPLLGNDVVRSSSSGAGVRDIFQTSITARSASPTRHRGSPLNSPTIDFEDVFSSKAATPVAPRVPLSTSTTSSSPPPESASIFDDFGTYSPLNLNNSDWPESSPPPRRVVFRSDAPEVTRIGSVQVLQQGAADAPEVGSLVNPDLEILMAYVVQNFRGGPYYGLYELNVVGVDDGRFYMRVSPDGLSLYSGGAPSSEKNLVDTRVTLSTLDLQQLLAGELDGPSAVALGKVQITGAYAKLLVFREIFQFNLPRYAAYCAEWKACQKEEEEELALIAQGGGLPPQVVRALRFLLYSWRGISPSNSETFYEFGVIAEYHYRPSLQECFHSDPPAALIVVSPAEVAVRHSDESSAPAVRVWARASSLVSILQCGRIPSSQVSRKPWVSDGGAAPPPMISIVGEDHALTQFLACFSLNVLSWERFKSEGFPAERRSVTELRDTPEPEDEEEDQDSSSDSASFFISGATNNTYEYDDPYNASTASSGSSLQLQTYEI